MIPDQIKLYLGDLRPEIDTLVQQTGDSPSKVLRDLLRRAIKMRIVYTNTDGVRTVEYFYSSAEAKARVEALGIDADIEEYVPKLGWVV